MLRHPNFVAKSVNASFETPPLACEASALTTELTARNHIYSISKKQLCKHRPLASSNFCADIGTLLHGYRLCAATEGKSPNAADIVISSVSYFQDFLISEGWPGRVCSMTFPWFLTSTKDARYQAVVGKPVANRGTRPEALRTRKHLLS